MPSIQHEAPLAVLRESPGLVPRLLRESLGVALPEYAVAELGDSVLTQVVSAELRADLVVCLRDRADGAPRAGIVVEIQRARDEDKRWQWPLYAAALHARLRCPTYLLVVAGDEATARWAATPVATMQPSAPFVPLVLGPDGVPRVPRKRARHDQWLAVLAAVVHGNRDDGLEAALTAIAAAQEMPEEDAGFCYDLVRASLGVAARRKLEELMLSRKYEYQSDFARHYFGAGKAEGEREGRQLGLQEGRQEGRQEGALAARRADVLDLADRHGAVSEALRERVQACADGERLRAVVLELAGAADRAAVEQILAALPG